MGNHAWPEGRLGPQAFVWPGSAHRPASQPPRAMALKEAFDRAMEGRAMALKEAFDRGHMRSDGYRVEDMPSRRVESIRARSASRARSLSRPRKKAAPPIGAPTTLAPAGDTGSNHDPSPADLYLASPGGGQPVAMEAFSSTLSVLTAGCPGLLEAFAATGIFDCMSVKVDGTSEGVALLAASICGRHPALVASLVTGALESILAAQEREIRASMRPQAAPAQLLAAPAAPNPPGDLWSNRPGDARGAYIYSGVESVATSSSSARPTLAIPPIGARCCMRGRGQKRPLIDYAGTRALAPAGETQSVLVSKHQTSIDRLLRNLEDAGDASTLLRNATPADRQEVISMLRAEWQLLPEGSLRHYADAATRWALDAFDRGIEPWAPKLVQMASYISAQRARGHSVPAGELSALSWLERNLRIDLQTTASLVKRQIRVHKRPAPVQLIPSVRVVLTLEHHASSSNIYVAMVSNAALIATFGSLRLGHVERSSLAQATPWYLEWLASRGKLRSGGVRKPFTWTSSRFGVTNLDTYVQLDRVYRLLDRRPKCPGRVPLSQQRLCYDIVPRGCALEDAEAVTDAPISSSRLLALIKAIVHEDEWLGASVDRKEIQKQLGDLTGHGLRHFCPTLASLAMYSTQERLAIGLWVGDRASGEISLVARQLAMPFLYDTERAHLEALGRTTLIRALRLALTRLLDSRDQWLGASPGLLCVLQDNARPCPSLNDLTPYWPNRAVADHSTSQFIKAKLAQDSLTTGTLLEKGFLTNGIGLPLEKTHVEADEASASSDTSALSSTSSSASSLDEVGLRVVHSKNAGGKLHVLSDKADPFAGGRCACGRTLRVPAHTTIEAALRTTRSWSPRCWAKLTHRGQLFAGRRGPPETLASGPAGSRRVPASSKSAALAPAGGATGPATAGAGAVFFRSRRGAGSASSCTTSGSGAGRNRRSSQRAGRCCSTSRPPRATLSAS